MAICETISKHSGKKSEKKEISPKKPKISQRTSDMSVPWEQDLPLKKRRYDVRYICGGPGKSGMGIVYLAYDREFDAPVAIKTFQNRFLGSPRMVDNFKKEAQVWVELEKHKNIVKATSVEIYVGRPYIFLELVMGDEHYGADLLGWIRGKGLDLPLMLNFAIQCCRGMSHAEKCFKEMGRVFVHRDIKPENIMVTRDKVVKVTDFGLVHAIRDEVFEPECISDEVHGRFSIVSQYGICGTPFYMSPEQVLQGAEKLKRLGILKKDLEVPILNLWSDMYAFGCVLYAMVKGNPPFREISSNLSSYYYQTLYEKPEPFSSGDKEFDDLIMQLLQKEPEKRGYQNFAELEKTLQAIYKHLTGGYLKEESPEEIQTWELVNRGVSFDHLGWSERAIEEYNKAIIVNSGNALAYNNRGLAYYHLSQHKQAIEDYNTAIEIEPGDARAYCNRGNIYYHLGQHEQAIKDYDKAIELGFAWAYCNRGNVYDDLGKFERAIKDYDQAIELNPQDVSAYIGRGSAYAHLSKHERAIEDFNAALELNPLEVNTYYNRGSAYKALERYGQAIKNFNEAIKLNPELVEAYNNRGNTYNALRQYEQAIEDYNTAIELNPEFALLYTNRGSAYASLGQYEQAIESFQQFIKLAPPQYAQHIVAVKEIIHQLSNHERVKKDHKKDTESDSEKATVYINCGNDHFRLGQYKQAIENYNMAIKINPKEAKFYVFRGRTYDALGQYEQVIGDYSKFIELNPSEAGIYILRGNAYTQLKQYVQAIEDYSKFIEFNPGGVDGYILRGNAYTQLEEYEQAIEDYNMVIRIEPRSEDYVLAYFSLGGIYAYLGRYDRAIESLRQFLKFAPSQYAQEIAATRKMIHQLGQSEQANEDHKKSVKSHSKDVNSYIKHGNDYSDLGQYRRL